MEEQVNGVVLLKPDASYKEEVLSYKQEMLDAASSFDGTAGLELCSTYEQWLDFDARLSAMYGDSYVPSTTYLAVRNGHVVGMIDIRHHLNDFMLNVAGHIGYSVRPSERRQGYATAMLNLALKQCDAMGINPVLVCCYSNNEASKRTILANGGILEDTRDGTERYWIR